MTYYRHQSGQITDCQIGAHDQVVVVIDPENRDQVEQFARAYEATWVDGYKSSESTIDIVVRQMQSALRSLATDPKPEEPRGLGAVVEDADGVLWVRCSPDRFRACSGEARGLYQRYAGADERDRIAAVRVLSQGVTA